MKLGIIVIFRNNLDDIEVKSLTESIKSNQNVKFCLVDNESFDDTVDALFEIKENCANVSIVEIKRQVNNKASKRAGARFMFNNYNLKHIGFVEVNTLKSKHINLVEFIKLISEDYESIIEYDKYLRSKYLIKPTLFNSVFPLMNYINDKFNSPSGSKFKFTIL